MSFNEFSLVKKQGQSAGHSKKEGHAQINQGRFISSLLASTQVQEKKTITDAVQIQKVIQKVFMKLPVRARGEEDVVEVKILSEGPGLIHVNAIGGKDKKRVLFTSQNDHFSSVFPRVCPQPISGRTVRLN